MSLSLNVTEVNVLIQALVWEESDTRLWHVQDARRIRLAYESYWKSFQRYQNREIPLRDVRVRLVQLRQELRAYLVDHDTFSKGRGISM